MTVKTPRHQKRQERRIGASVQFIDKTLGRRLGAAMDSAMLVHWCIGDVS